MKISIKYIISLAFMTMALSAAVVAQAPSLANIGHDVYASSADGFEIAVPNGCFKITNGDDGRTYTCDIKEGRITVMISPDNPEVKTDADLAMFLKGIRAGMTDEPGVKILGEADARIGSYRGSVYQMTVNDNKALMVALAWGKFMVSISGVAFNSVPGSDKLIANAVQSFTFVSPKTK